MLMWRTVIWIKHAPVEFDDPVWFFLQPKLTMAATAKKGGKKAAAGAGS